MAHAFDTIDGSDKHSGPDTNAREPLRARALAACSSHAARGSAYEDMHMSPQLHRYEQRGTGKHLEARSETTPFASWQTKQSRGQSPLPSLMLQHCSTPRFQPAPAPRLGGHELVAAAPPARKLHAAAQLLPRGHSACRSGLAQEVRDGCNSLVVEEGQLEAPAPRRSP